MAKVVQCDRCKKIIKPTTAYTVELEPGTYDLCVSCEHELEEFMKIKEGKTNECSV
ncbi:MAG: hypothetical protein NC215_00350 [Ruminococcus sp.]|nr:hypothetical protein [Ruminococcus sp.]